jgi:16S rRNA (cytosine1402-N4)-methyltransferase
VATLLEMTITHVPVLAGELIELLDPQPGAIAVDCTVGGGGHARLIAERIGSSGTLIGIDRDPTAQERFEELSREVGCTTRFIRASFADGLALLHDERVVADYVYFDLGTSAMQIDTWERGFSYAYDAPLDMSASPPRSLARSSQSANARRSSRRSSWSR